MNIEILDIGEERTESKNGRKWRVFDLSYKNTETGEVAGKSFRSFSPLYENLRKLSIGEKVQIHAEKNDSGFWEWVSIGEEDTPTKQPQRKQWKGVPVQSDRYESPEERKWRQTLIVRQSSVGAAVELLKTEKSAPAVKDVLAAAAEIENWVMRS